jgi:pimeloyl-ACP methyl ester carboxylesterase
LTPPWRGASGDIEEEQVPHQVTAERITVRAQDGRQLGALIAGPPDGLPLLLHTGTPSGLVEWPAMTQAAAGRGLRLILYSRPGYGGSTPLPGRSVADAAADSAAILDQLGAGRFVTAGWSGGGPHALAAAALLADRCAAAATIAGVAPRAEDGLDWLAGMGPENVEEFTAALAGQEQLTRYLESAADQLRSVTAQQVADSLGGLVSAADLAALTGDFAGYLAACFRAAVSAGVAGWRDDDLAFVRDWGFAVEAAGRTVPVSVWQGDADRMVPFAHGRWLAERIPGAAARLLPGDGHLTLIARRFGEIIDDLVAAAGRR